MLRLKFETMVYDELPRADDSIVREWRLLVELEGQHYRTHIGNVVAIKSSGVFPQVEIALRLRRRYDDVDPTVVTAIKRYIKNFL